jgi:hypothetical protein
MIEFLPLITVGATIACILMKDLYDEIRGKRNTTVL